MIRDDRLIAPGHEDKMLDSGLARFLDDVLKDRAIDDRQHFLGNRFGGRKKPCSQTGDGKNGLANASRQQFLRVLILRWNGKLAQQYSTRVIAFFCFCSPVGGAKPQSACWDSRGSVLNFLVAVLAAKLAFRRDRSTP